MGEQHELLGARLGVRVAAPPASVAQEVGARFLADVLAGLSSRPRTLPCKWLYDARGSSLFERICALPEYYLTRTELEILERDAGEMARAIGPRALVVEPGSGAGAKSELLLSKLPDPVAYMPVDISPCAMAESVLSLGAAHPGLEILPLCADFTAPFELAWPARSPERVALFFPGSTIGNFDPSDAVALLSGWRTLAGDGAMLLLGVDLWKSESVLRAAYDDAAGVTADFNLNLLRRINRELGADFDLRAFAHRIVVDADRRRVEMHLESLSRQRVRLSGRSFDFEPGETIHTESSYKYTLTDIGLLAERSGWRLDHVWSDDERRFAEVLLGARD